MPKVPLQVPAGHTGLIIAPDFCPYKEEGFAKYNPPKDSPLSGPQFRDLQLRGQVSVQAFVVHASICLLCKICTFVGPDVVLPNAEPTEAQRQAFAEYLTSKNVAISKSISGQNQYLNKEDRIPLMLLISYDVVVGMLEYVISDVPRRQEVLSYALSEQQLCHVLGVPVHFSNKLSKTPVQLVGEIIWK